MDNIVRQLRTERGWTQADLAEQLGVSRQTVNSLEKGRYDPSLPLAFRIGRVLDKPIEQIFFDTPAEPRSDVIPSPTAPGDSEH